MIKISFKFASSQIQGEIKCGGKIKYYTCRCTQGRPSTRRGTERTPRLHNTMRLLICSQSFRFSQFSLFRFLIELFVFSIPS